MIPLEMWHGKKRMAPGALLCRTTLFPSHSDQVTSGEALCRLYTYARKRADTPLKISH